MPKKFIAYNAIDNVVNERANQFGNANNKKFL